MACSGAGEGGHDCERRFLGYLGCERNLKYKLHVIRESSGFIHAVSLRSQAQVCPWPQTRTPKRTGPGFLVGVFGFVVCTKIGA